MKLILFFLFSAITVFAQTPEWSRKYHTGSVTCLDFSSDGKLIASGSIDHSLKLLGIDGGEEKKKFNFTISSFGGEVPASFVFSNRDRNIEGMRYYTYLEEPYLKRPSSFLIHLDKDEIESGFPFDKSINYAMSSVISFYSLFHSYTAVINDSTVLNGVFGSIEGFSTYLKISGIGGVISMDNTSSGKHTVVDNDGSYNDGSYEKLAPGYSTIVLSNDKTRFFASGKRQVNKEGRGQFYTDQRVYTNLVNLFNNEKIHFEIFKNEVIRNAVFTRDDKNLVISRANGEINIFDLAGKYQNTLSNATSLTTALVTDKLGRFIISTHNDTTLRLWKFGTSNIFKKLKLHSPVTTIAVSPDSVHFATGHTDGTIAYWNLDSLFLKARIDSVFTPSITPVKDKVVECLGTSATFEVIAQSNFGEELSYQWKKGGVNLVDTGSISGVKTPTLLLSDLTKANEGQYEIEVLTSKGGRNILNSTYLTVIDSPVIIKQPYLITGGIDYLKVEIKNPEISQLQWYKNGEIIHAAVDSNLQLRAYRDSGVYHVRITNFCKSRDSEKFYYHVKATSIVENPFKNTTLSAEPNPFKNSTRIRFSLPKPLKVKLAVTDILGREIAVLKDEVVEIGEQNVAFKNEDLPDGTYFVTLSGDGLLKTIPVQITR